MFEIGLRKILTASKPESLALIAKNIFCSFQDTNERRINDFFSLLLNLMCVNVVRMREMDLSLAVISADDMTYLK